MNAINHVNRTTEPNNRTTEQTFTNERTHPLKGVRVRTVHIHQTKTHNPQRTTNKKATGVPSPP